MRGLLATYHKRGGWQPGAKTLFYLPLNSTYTYTDKSSNERATSKSGTITFETYQGVDCGKFNSGLISITPFELPTEITVLFWAYNTGVNNTDGKIFIADTEGGGTLKYIITAMNNDGYGNNVYDGNNWGGNIGAYNYKNQWVLVALTINNSSRKIYIKGHNIDSSQTGNNGSLLPFTPNHLLIGGQAGTSRYFLGGISEVICENKIWTAQEIADYYNQTKSLYGIS